MAFVTFGTNPARAGLRAGDERKTAMSAVAVRAMFRSHPEKPAHSEAMSRCIDACFNCVETCTACADACLSERDVAHLVVMHSSQSRLRRGVQRHRQHHVALQQGRAPAAPRSATGQLHRVLPRLRRRMRRPRRNAPALRRLRRSLHGLRRGLHADAVDDADAGVTLSARPSARSRPDAGAGDQPVSKLFAHRLSTEYSPPPRIRNTSAASRIRIEYSIRLASRRNPWPRSNGSRRS